jgi:hypothetical protein
MKPYEAITESVAQEAPGTKNISEAADEVKPFDPLAFQAQVEGQNAANKTTAETGEFQVNPFGDLTEDQAKSLAKEFLTDTNNPKYPQIKEWYDEYLAKQDTKKPAFRIQDNSLISDAMNRLKGKWGFVGEGGDWQKMLDSYEDAASPDWPHEVLRGIGQFSSRNIKEGSLLQDIGDANTWLEKNMLGEGEIPEYPVEKPKWLWDTDRAGNPIPPEEPWFTTPGVNIPPPGIVLPPLAAAAQMALVPTTAPMTFAQAIAQTNMYLTASGMQTAAMRQMIAMAQDKSSDDVLWDAAWGYIEGIAYDKLILKGVTKFGGKKMGLDYMEKMFNISSKEAIAASNFAAEAFGKEVKQGWLSKGIEKITGGRWKWLKEYNVSKHGLTSAEQRDMKKLSGWLGLLQQVAEGSALTKGRMRDWYQKTQQALFRGFDKTKVLGEDGKARFVPMDESYLLNYVKDMASDFGGWIEQGDFGRLMSSIAHDLFRVVSAPAANMRKEIVDKAGDAMVNISESRIIINRALLAFKAQGGESGVTLANQLTAAFKGMVPDEVTKGGWNSVQSMEGGHFLLDDAVPLRNLADPFTGVIAILGRATRNQGKTTPMTTFGRKVKAELIRDLRRTLKEIDPTLAKMWNKQNSLFKDSYGAYKTAWLDGMWKTAFVDSGKQGMRPDKIFMSIAGAGTENIKKITGMMTPQSKLALGHMFWRNALSKSFERSDKLGINILNPRKLKEFLYGKAGEEGVGGLGAEAVDAIIGESGVKFSKNLINFLEQSQKSLEETGGILPATVFMTGIATGTKGLWNVVEGIGGEEGDVSSGLGLMALGAGIIYSPEIFLKLLISPAGRELITKSMSPGLTDALKTSIKTRILSYMGNYNQIFKAWLGPMANELAEFKEPEPIGTPVDAARTALQKHTDAKDQLLNLGEVEVSAGEYLGNGSPE